MNLDEIVCMDALAYMRGLWQRTSKQLRGELDLNPKQNLRDHFSTYALTYTRIAEMVAADKLGEAVEVTEKIAMELIYDVAKMIGGQARETAALLNINPITGQRLLKG